MTKYMIKLIGKKIGMNHIYDKTGNFIPVSVIFIPKHYIVEIIKQNYFIIKLCAYETKTLNKSLNQLFIKKNIPICKKIWEFRYKSNEFITHNYIDISIFKINQILNISGISKGKGFAGVVKRWGFSMQDATHGNSLSHRAPGSIGQNQSPGRVIKGKKMAGHLGNKKITIKNLIVLDIELNKQLLFVKGGIPGSKNSNIFIYFTI